MKFKPIPYIRFFGRWFLIAIGVGMFLAGVWFAIGLRPEERCFETYAIAVLCLLYSVIIFPYCLHQVWEKYFATIFISNSKITWRCPFYKTKSLLTPQCCIGVEKEVSYWKFEYNYIYFSLNPYPHEFANMINKIPCSETFLKYRYDPKLAEYILKTVPKEQTKQLDYFHYTYLRNQKKYHN